MMLAIIFGMMSGIEASSEWPEEIANRSDWMLGISGFSLSPIYRLGQLPERDKSLLSMRISPFWQFIWRIRFTSRIAITDG